MGDSAGNSSSWDAETFESWLEQTAESRDASSEEILSELATSLWVLDELEGLLDQAELQDEFPERVQTNSEDTDPAEHTEPNSSESETPLSAIVSSLEALESRVDSLHEAQSSLEDDVSTDIDNVEEVLRYLVNQTDALSDDIASLNDRFESIEAELRSLRATQEQLADLKTEASRHGVAAADCENCGNTVDLSMLVYPECPTCGLALDTVTPKSWLFGSATVGAQGTARTRNQDLISSTLGEPPEDTGNQTSEPSETAADDDDFDMADFEWQSR